MIKLFTLFFSFILSLSVSAQSSYLLHLASKNISKTQLALSKESILRKKKFNIPIDDKDYSLEPEKLSKIRDIVPQIKVSKWLNAVYLEATPTELQALRKLTFIEKIEFLGDLTVKKLSTNKLESNYTVAEYGSSYPQLKIHHLDSLHNYGYEGQGLKIAVFDAGFINADTFQSLSHLFKEDRIFSVKNLVENSQNTFRLDGHGTGVLGCMASFVKDTIIGSAPKATYYLFITENVASESKQEEVNWAIAAEMADSMGIDIVNSSLGYTEFDDFNTNYTKDQLDGQTTISAKAAKIACEKGILVVNSAGNLGNKAWHVLASPADVEDVISVGAIDLNLTITDFSSRGYNAQKNIKPSVVSVGKGALMNYHQGSYSYGTGTSFASPLMAGMVACFWQKNSTLKSEEVRRKLYTQSSQYLSPNYEYGFGIPSFKSSSAIIPIYDSIAEIVIYPNPSSETAIVELFSKYIYENTSLEIFHFNKSVVRQTIDIKKGRNQYYIDLKDFNQGLYFLKIKTGTHFIEKRFNKI